MTDESTRKEPSGAGAAATNEVSPPAPAPVPPIAASPVGAGASAPTEEDEILDATVPDPNVAAPSLTAVPLKRFDPDEFRDQARKKITYWLLFLLTLLFVGAFATLFLLEDKVTFDHLKGLLEILLGPLVALVSAATGFYFGAQSGGKSNT